MEKQIAALLDLFASGRMTRREAVARLSALAAAAAGLGSGGAAAQAVGSTFKAVGLNHIALRVTDVARSRDFYIKHLGMKVDNESLPGNCFLTFDNGFLALFRGDQPRMDHYCYSVENYDVDDAVEKLRGEGLNPRRPSGTRRVYFPDPNGLTVQLAAPNHGPSEA